VKILIFSAFDPIPSDNISPIRYAHLAEEFLKNGHEVEYVTSFFFHLKKTFRFDKEWSEIGTPKNLKLTKIPTPSYRSHVGLKRLYSHYILGQNLDAYLKQREKEDFPQLIICAYPPIWANYFLADWANKNHIPFILDIQDLWPYNFKQFLPVVSNIFLGPLKKRFQFIISKAAAFAPVSGDYLRYIPKKFLSKPNKIFRLGIESELFPTIAEAKNSSDTIELLYVGTGLTNRLLHIAISALSNAKNVNLHIIGLGDFSKNIEEDLQKNNVKNIRVTPWLNQKELKEEAVKYDAALLLVNTKSLIFFPNKAFAYFAAGLPVISNIRGGELEKIISVNNLGLTIKHDTEAEILKAVEILRSKKDIAKRIKIQQFARDNFDSESIYKQYYIWAMQVFKGNL
jgi:glycosyltransferase involved in cell wall biosynthesis